MTTMTRPLLQNWFIPAEGISRQVISADIQRWLGNDATVRPSRGVADGQEVDGYLIKAYRNLTSEMINDLKLTTERWEREQQPQHPQQQHLAGPERRNGPVPSYLDLDEDKNYRESRTYRATHSSIMSAGSPHHDAPFAQPPPTSRSGPLHQEMSYMAPYPVHSAPPGTSGYSEPPIYAANQARPLYNPPVEHYPQSYPDLGPQHPRNSPQYPGPQYNNPPYGQYPSRDYQDPRYHTYSPAVTMPNGGSIHNQPPPISYSSAVSSGDHYGGRSFPTTSVADSQYRPATSAEPPYHRDRPTGQQGPDTRRRRIN